MGPLVCWRGGRRGRKLGLVHTHVEVMDTPTAYISIPAYCIASCFCLQGTVGLIVMALLLQGPCFVGPMTSTVSIASAQINRLSVQGTKGSCRSSFAVGPSGVYSQASYYFQRLDQAAGNCFMFMCRLKPSPRSSSCQPWKLPCRRATRSQSA